MIQHKNPEPWGNELSFPQGTGTDRWTIIKDATYPGISPHPSKRCQFHPTANIFQNTFLKLPLEHNLCLSSSYLTVITRAARAYLFGYFYKIEKILNEMFSFSQSFFSLFKTKYHCVALDGQWAWEVFPPEHWGYREKLLPPAFSCMLGIWTLSPCSHIKNSTSWSLQSPNMDF